VNQQIIDELRERIARLEAARPRRRRYNQKQTATELDMSVQKLRAEQKAGRIRGTLSGRTWFFTDEEIQRYLAARAEGDAA
jgi:hypothetical protein